MAGRAESLNVGVACAVLCFEALRQRRTEWCGPAGHRRAAFYDALMQIDEIERAGRRRDGRRHQHGGAWPRSESAVLGKRGPLALAHRQLGALEPDARREAGRVLHEARQRLEAVVAEQRRASWPPPSAGPCWPLTAWT